METFPPVATLLFLVSLVLLGMPHGAIDHLVFFRSIEHRMTVGRVLSFIAVYLGVVAIFLLLWFWQPVPCAVAFLILTAWHWGEGDRLYERQHGRKMNGAFAWFRGAIPMLIPVIVYPAAAVAVLDAAARAGGAENPDWAWLQETPVRLAMAMLLLILYILARRSTPYPRRASLEDLGLMILFVLLPPLLAVAVYFVGWHSLRHIRTTASWMKSPIGGADGRVCWRAFSLHALPFTAPAVLAVGWLAWRDQQAGMPMDAAWVGSYLVWLWALTWPHSVVCWLAEGRIDRGLRPESRGPRINKESVEVSNLPIR